MYKARSGSVIHTEDLYGIHYNLYDGNNYSSRAFQNSLHVYGNIATRRTKREGQSLGAIQKYKWE